MQRIRALHDWFVRQGDESPLAKWVEHMDERDAEAAETGGCEAATVTTTRSSSVTTTRVDVRDQIEVGRAALLAHHTQIPADSFFFRVPLEVEQELHPWEEYVLARIAGGSGRARGRVRDRSLRGAPGGGEALTASEPPDDERSELDDALFSGAELDHTPTRSPRPPAPDEDLSKLDTALFGEFDAGAAGCRGP